MDKINNLLRMLPSVDELSGRDGIRNLAEACPRDKVVEGIRLSIEHCRNEILRGFIPDDRERLASMIALRAESLIAGLSRPSLLRIINATGVIIHTNLGRAVLCRRAIELAVEAAAGYTNLEFDTERGIRGKRMTHLKKYLIDLTGAEDALVVNNNGASVLLFLDTFAKDREVIVSRGELIELGGSFRLPDVLKKSGAVLREVGCTNKTHLRDYEEAINENTAAIIKIHKSNYAIMGFTAEVPGEEIASLGKKHNIITLEDLGSGLMTDLSKYGLHGEPTVRQTLEKGMDLVTFSGDKLLGGPQGGVVVGRGEIIRKMSKNPLQRALRLDKMTIAAFEGTLSLYQDPEKLEKEMPVIAMLAKTPHSIKERCERIRENINRAQPGKTDFSLVPGASRTGGGAFPIHDIPTMLMAIGMEGYSPEDLRKTFLGMHPPVLGRIEKDSFVLDLRTVQDHEDPWIEKAILNMIEQVN